MKSGKSRWIALAILSVVVIASAMGRKEKKAAVQTGVKGKVEIHEGNFMPMTDPKSSGNGKVTPGAGRRVRLHEPLKVEGLMSAKRDSIPSVLVAETVCDKNGEFVLPARAGQYSIFVEDAGGWYFNGFSGDGIQGSVTVEEGKLSEIVIKITSKATY